MNGTSPRLAIIGAVVVAFLIVISALVFAWISAPSNPATVPYTRFLDDVGSGRVVQVAQQGTTLRINGRDGAYEVIVPTVLTDVYGDMQEAATAGGEAVPEFSALEAPDTSWIGLILTVALPLLLILGVIVLVLFLVMRPAQRADVRGLADRLRELDKAHRAGLISDEEHERQRVRILNEV